MTEADPNPYRSPGFDGPLPSRSGISLRQQLFGWVALFLGANVALSAVGGVIASFVPHQGGGLWVLPVTLIEVGIAFWLIRLGRRELGWNHPPESPATPAAGLGPGSPTEDR